jgi:shikimate kinase
MITPDNVILCGFMGTGKTTVGKIVASRLKWRFADTDHLIERKQGRTISAIFAEDGEPAFRKLESEMVATLRHVRCMVIATGGGILLNPDNRDALQRSGLVICLDAPAEEIVARLAAHTDRPLLAAPDPKSRVAELMAARTAAYAAIKHHVNTAGKTPEQIAQAVLSLRETMRSVQENAKLSNSGR